MRSKIPREFFCRASFQTATKRIDPDAIRTLPELVEYNAAYNPQHIFCIQANKGREHTTVSHLELKHAVLRCSAWLKNSVPGLREPLLGKDGNIIKGPPIALLMESDIGIFIYFLALLGLGVPVLVLSARLSPFAIKQLLSETNACSILTSSHLGRNAGEALSFPGSPRLTPPGLLDAAPYQSFLGLNLSPEESICGQYHFTNMRDRNVLILHSSGTTGLPKALPHAHEFLMRFVGCHEFDVGFDSESRNLSTLPLYHGFGLVAPILSLSIGKTLCLPTSSLVPTGPSTVEALLASQASSLMTVPSILEELCDMPDSKGTQALAPLQFVGFGGGLLKVSVGERLQEAGVQVVNTLGTTETGPLCPMFVPPPDYDWHYFRLRKDLDLKLEELDGIEGQVPRFKLIVYLAESDTHFELQDLLISNPKNPGSDFTTIGRGDDLIVLATGEKVSPIILENLLSESTLVKSAVAFGEGQFEIGVIVEPSLPIAIGQYEQFKSSIWPIILEAGKQMDSHARLSSPSSIILVPSGKKIPRTDKGSVAKKEVYRVFEAEMVQAYQDLESNVVDASLSTLDLTRLEKDLKSLVQSRLDWKIPDEEWSYDHDLFELGMDSLQAIRLRRFLVACVPKSCNVQPPSQWINRNFVYEYPSINKIAVALRNSEMLGSSPNDQQRQIDEFVNSYSVKKSRLDHLQGSGLVILLTGSTGSLGCHLLALLVNLPSVDRVICLNRTRRSSNLSAHERQIQSMKKKGLQLTPKSLSKVEIIQTNSEALYLGLSEPRYNGICRQVTHILHNAWPMNFNRKLPSFEAQFRTLHRLLNLARAAHFAQPVIKPKLLFVSSIGVVGHYGFVHGGTLVPETSINDQKCTTPIGYGAAKLVCERILENAEHDFGNEIEVAYVRIGQMSGSKETGFWNTEEHFPALVKSSQRIGRLPRLKGTFSWIPVDTTAAVLSEVLLTAKPPSSIFHLENPVRQSWHDAIAVLGRELSLDTTETLPFDEWLDRVCATSNILPGDNPANELSDFFKTDFERMSSGKVSLATDNTRAVSPTLRSLGEVQDETISAYVRYWRSVNFIH